MDEKELFTKIKDSDYLISDICAENIILGLKYDAWTMFFPKITFICSKKDMLRAKWFSYILHKEIIVNPDYTNKIFKAYNNLETLSVDDYLDVIHYL